ncbi:peroxiredoxin [Aureimonas fodinaquatilis]|uniref:thioredoxin-dependent peroxiredoxin n=1 Tax=Aureimonas fodinaquatilis TaxID=2565783 RepID=A0A5B0DUV6_9HYPH|nr:peroxiredoxin [Aureimonas fodinaquatilis]KAA0970554.1 peroxiredoxin [Aureimonas fodinaquatilis]
MLSVVEGDTLPDFSLSDADGQTVSRQQLGGKPFVLYFYPKDDTPGCTTEALDFSALLKKFEALGAEVFGVSPDSVAKHCKFRDKQGLKVRLLADEEHQLLKAVGVWAEKRSFGRTSMGVERTTLLVDADGRIARIWPKVKVSGHAVEVLDAVRELNAAPSISR